MGWDVDPKNVLFTGIDTLLRLHADEDARATYEYLVRDVGGKEVQQ